MSSTCDECGGEINISDWPFCGGDPKAHVQASYFGEEPLTPYVDENLGPEPIEIRTRGERRRIMRESHLEYLDVSEKRRGSRIYVDLAR